MDYAIDTSYLRKPELEAALQASSASDRFVLADTAVVETMKNAQWELTARLSFEIISRYPLRVWTATEPPLLMQAELETGRDTTEVTDSRLTAAFRKLLVEISSGNDGPTLAHIRNEIVGAQTTMANEQQDHCQNIADLKAARDAVTTCINVQKYRRLPDEASKRGFRLSFAKALAQKSLREIAQEEGKSPEIGDALANGRGFILRHLIGHNLLGFKWAINNGLDCFPAHKATNELMDLRHAVIGTFCDGILTAEASVTEMRQDILDALDVEPLQLTRSAED